jgi:hypothetical protein
MTSRRVESFLVKLVVQEDGGCEPDAWRGRIQRISTGDAQQFNNVEGIIAFIRSQFATAGSAPLHEEPDETRLP